MRIIALFALIIGVSTQLILTGNPYHKLIFGIVCGIVAIVFGFGSGSSDDEDRWAGILGGAGVILVLILLIMLPWVRRNHLASQLQKPATPHSLVNGSAISNQPSTNFPATQQPTNGHP
jgi:multisubunit Na+/H+ antiporter MnhB subunit